MDICLNTQTSGNLTVSASLCYDFSVIVLLSGREVGFLGEIKKASNTRLIIISIYSVDSSSRGMMKIANSFWLKFFWRRGFKNFYGFFVLRSSRTHLFQSVLEERSTNERQKTAF